MPLNKIPTYLFLIFTSLASSGIYPTCGSCSRTYTCPPGDVVMGFIASGEKKHIWDGLVFRRRTNGVVTLPLVLNRILIVKTEDEEGLLCGYNVDDFGPNNRYTALRTPLSRTNKCSLYTKGNSKPLRFVDYRGEIVNDIYAECSGDTIDH